MNVSLVMFKADGSRRDFTLDKSRFVLGRTNTCDLRIPLSSVSRQHCEIRVEKDRVLVRDLGSSNGTFHNGTRITEAVLSAGDEIAIGQVVFTVVVNGKPAKIEPVQSTMEQTAVSQPALDESVPLEEAPTPAPQAKQPEVVPEPEDEELIPVEIEDEPHTPTVDLDDPIAALEAMAEAETGKTSQVPSLAPDDEDEAQDVPLLAEDDDDPPPAKG